MAVGVCFCFSVYRFCHIFAIWGTEICWVFFLIERKLNWRLYSPSVLLQNRSPVKVYCAIFCPGYVQIKYGEESTQRLLFVVMQYTTFTVTISVWFDENTSVCCSQLLWTICVVLLNMIQGHPSPSFLLILFLRTRCLCFGISRRLCSCISLKSCLIFFFFFLGDLTQKYTIKNVSLKSNPISRSNAVISYL